MLDQNTLARSKITSFARNHRVLRAQCVLEHLLYIFTMITDHQMPSVESFNMADIEDQTHLYREHMIALALLIGCDYCPKGVPGVGKTQALKLCLQVPRHEILKK